MSRFLMAVRSGSSRRDAARFAGISEATLYRWMKGDGRQYETFRRLTHRAEIELKVEVTANLVMLTRTSTRAALFWLRSRYPEDWPTTTRLRG